MYTRQNPLSKSGRGIELPGNYGGTAFRQEPVTEDAELQEACPPHNNGEPYEAAPTLSVQSGDDICDTEKTAPAISDRHFQKEGGIGFEELLILGIILLISQNSENDDNISLLLLLLLLIR